MATFKTKARALDLLGKQQIAGIPTAINELLKNAHDAYADKVEIDYFRLKKLFILRDDGIGMSKEDFETRWLTLGTESKLDNNKISKPPIDTNKKYRITMGEKGIGRLAIASIGKQVLVVSKLKNHDKIVCAFINWQIFELPSLILDEIPIPVRECEKLPNINEVDSMKQEMINGIEKLYKKSDIQKEDFIKICEDINNFDIVPDKIDKQLVGNFPLDYNDGGTFFYIAPVDENLNSDIDENNNPDESTKMEKMLMGFHNTMTPNHPEPTLDIVFRDYRKDNEQYVDIINKDYFFTEEDFKLADHHISGKFDVFGQFKGTIGIYREKIYEEHIINWNENRYLTTVCGSFEINLAYLQGIESQSIVDMENFARITKKSKKFGGLYIYKDNIRMLPYGNYDYDYLDIEKNRTMHAGNSFFSYRRMFGAISISSENNFNLIEKAGREGFIENKAYKQFKSILKHFFYQLAIDFFRDDGGPKSVIWSQKRKELISSHEALQKREKMSKERKKNFEKKLSSFFDNLRNSTFDKEIEKIHNDAKRDFDCVFSIENKDIASQKILDIEKNIRKSVSSFEKSLAIPTPRGFTIKKESKQDYESYLENMEKIILKIHKEIYEKIDEYIEEIKSKMDIQVSKRKRLELAVDEISNEADKINKDKARTLSTSVNNIKTRTANLTRELMIELDNEIRKVKDGFKKISIIDENDIDLMNKRNEMSNKIENISQRNVDILDTLIRQLESVSWQKGSNNNIITNEQMTDALSEEVQELKEKMYADIELSQLGLAVGIIGHEFSSTTRSIRANIKDLKSWSDINEQIEKIYKNIKINFEHLDGYLNLFTPLDRRLRREQEEINLMDIKYYLLDLFENRLSRHNIKLQHTKGYKKRTVFGFRSTIYPVFINIIDNAIYWLKQSVLEEKIILLHADENSIYISNNGEKLQIQDKDRIFNLGFTRKTNGRGMGLHISKEILNTIGYSLVFSMPQENMNVTFEIKRIK